MALLFFYLILPAKNTLEGIIFLKATSNTEIC